MFNGFELNVLPSIFGIIIYVAIGAIWYSPMFLGKIWMKLKNLTQEDFENNNQSMGLAFVSAIVSVLVLHFVTFWSQVTTIVDGFILSILITLLVSTVGFNAVCFDKKEGFVKRLQLWLLDTGYILTTFTVIITLFALWN